MHRDDRSPRDDARSFDGEARERQQFATREHNPRERDITIRDQPSPEARADEKYLGEKEKTVGQTKELNPEEKKDLFEKQKQSLRDALDKGDVERMKEVVSQMDFKTERSTAVFWSGKIVLSNEQVKEYQAQRERGEHKWESLKPGDDGRWTVSNRDRAEAFCAKEKALGAKWTTLEQTEAGRFLDDQKLFDKPQDISRADALEIWVIASKRYATAASGTAIAFETNAREISTWKQTESNALRENHRVTNIISDSPKLDAQGLPFERNSTDLRS